MTKSEFKKLKPGDIFVTASKDNSGSKDLPSTWKGKLVVFIGRNGSEGNFKFLDPRFDNVEILYSDEVVRIDE